MSLIPISNAATKLILWLPISVQISKVIYTFVSFLAISACNMIDLHYQFKGHSE